MIAYSDTSAVLPLIVEEPGSAVCERLWADADRVLSVRLLYAEARAALAQAHRMGRLDAADPERVTERDAGRASHPG